MSQKSWPSSLLLRVSFDSWLPPLCVCAPAPPFVCLGIGGWRGEDQVTSPWGSQFLMSRIQSTYLPFLVFDQYLFHGYKNHYERETSVTHHGWHCQRFQRSLKKNTAHVHCTPWYLGHGFPKERWPSQQTQGTTPCVCQKNARHIPWASPLRSSSRFLSFSCTQG